MKPPLPRILSEVPCTLHAQLEIAKAIRTLIARDEDEPLRQHSNELAAIRGELEAIKRDFKKAAEECSVLVNAELRKYGHATRSLEEVDKAGFRSDQPRWPKASGEISGRWSGGAGEAPASPPKAPPVEIPRRPWAIGHNQGPPLDEPPPEIPSEEPPTKPEGWDFAKTAGKWLVRAGVRTAVRVAVEATIGGPVGDFLLALEAAYWLYEYVPAIHSSLDPPKTWEELQQNWGPGYERHHVVEQWGENDGIPRSKIDAPENVVPIPKMKHWDINGWLDRPNDDYRDAENQKMTPREYMRGKTWEERYSFGLYVLRKFEVLKR